MTVTRWLVKHDAVIAWLVAATWAPSSLPGGQWTHWALTAVCLCSAFLSLLLVRRKSTDISDETLAEFQRRLDAMIMRERREAKYDRNLS